MAREYFPDAIPLGSASTGAIAALHHIGVVDDVHISALDADPPPMIYNAMFQTQSGASSRTAFLLAPTRAGQDLFQRSAATGLVGRSRSSSVQQHHPRGAGVGFRGAAALHHAAADCLLHDRRCCWRRSDCLDVISYLVSQRQRDMALRMALGADRSNIHRMVLKRGAFSALLVAPSVWYLSLAGGQSAGHEFVSASAALIRQL